MLLSAAFPFLLTIITTIQAQNATTPSTARPKPNQPDDHTPPHAFPQCVISCAQLATEANGCSLYDMHCICNSPQVQIAALNCLRQTCTPDEMAAAADVGLSRCNELNTNDTGQVSTSPNQSTSKDDTVNGAVTSPSKAGDNPPKNAPSPVAMQQSSVIGADITAETQSTVAYTPTLQTGTGCVLNVNLWWMVAAFVLCATL